MPRGDQTGPMSQGQMTGRKRVFCAGFEGPGYARAGRRRRRAAGSGSGRGLDPGSPNLQHEPSGVSELSDRLKSRLEAVEMRLAQIERND